MIELDVSAWTGLKLVQNGRMTSVSLFGDSTTNMLASSPAALDAFSTYRALRITGTILYLIGTSALIATLSILIADRTILVDDGIKAAFWGLFIPGTALGLAGGIMMGASSSYVAKAVRLYNEDLYRRLSAGAPRAWMLSLRRRF